MLEELFNFPIVMIDGDNEEKKIKEREKESSLLNKDVEDEEEYDIVFGRAEYPYWDFIGIEDRWLPSTKSLQKAMSGKFDACMVRFANVGQLLVPWPKTKFKEELVKFGEAYEASKPPKEPETRKIQVLTLTQEQYKNINDGKKEGD